MGFLPLKWGAQGVFNPILKKKKKIKTGLVANQKKREGDPSLPHDLPLHFTASPGRAPMSSSQPSSASSHLSLTQALSFPLFLSLSLSLSLLFLSLNRGALGSSAINCGEASLGACTGEERSEDAEMGEASTLAAEAPSAVAVDRAWDAAGRTAAKFYLQPLPPPSLGANQFPLMVPLVRDESSQINNTHFRTNWRNFDSWSEPNGALFWCNNLALLIVVKNYFQWYIICLCLDLFEKKVTFFETICKLPI